ncbi:hypothetical protein PG997_008894 [Apiospora hydei]|uniref:HTH araC/xylS-type domain-containing protein n=1 Tax=Apiospora hydei TaxID=1337664 RepID=A0ABR1WC22_9PEZI
MPYPFFPNDSARWNAVQRKDVLADGVFLYAVRTTKIYCRPVCKARLARRANVDFYDTAQEAERAGYRPCKRCKPDSAGRMPENRSVRRVRAMMEHELPAPIVGASASTSAGAHVTLPPVNLGCLEQMAKQAGLSRWHFHRTFKEVTNMTPMRYLRQKSDSTPSYSAMGTEEPLLIAESYGVAGETAVAPELGSLAVQSTEEELAATMSLPLCVPGLEHSEIGTSMPEDVYFDFDKFITDIDNSFHGPLFSF